MYGVSKISIETSLMMISVQDVEFKGNSLARYLQIFADNGVVVDMISQSAPHGTTIDFSFTASSSDLPLVMKAISVANLDKDAKASPLISVGYSKLNLIFLLFFYLIYCCLAEIIKRTSLSHSPSFFTISPSALLTGESFGSCMIGFPLQSY